MLGGIYCTSLPQSAVDIRILQRREKIVIPEVHVYDSECVQETDQWSEKVLFIHSSSTEQRSFEIIFNYSYKSKMTQQCVSKRPNFANYFGSHCPIHFLKLQMKNFPFSFC